MKKVKVSFTQNANFSRHEYVGSFALPTAIKILSNIFKRNNELSDAKEVIFCSETFTFFITGQMEMTHNIKLYK